jgi:peptide/nickel transport system permease protein
MNEETKMTKKIIESSSLGTEKKERTVYTASQTKLIARKFFKHKLAVIGIAILVLFYLSALFAPLLVLHDPGVFNDAYTYAPPQFPRFWDENGFSIKPFYYALEKRRNPETFAMDFVLNIDSRHYVEFFAQGFEYKLLGIFPASFHFMVDDGEAPLFLFGTDRMGRDLYSRNMYASRISLTVGLVGVSIAFILGCILGGISGFYGGLVDVIIQRLIEFLISIPTLPLWMALSASLPRTWSQMQTYFAITVILAIASWTGLARVVRGKLISIREEDFVTAAVISGVSDWKIILRHMLPAFSGYLIVNLTLSIPSMILGETALSFLGLGLQPPMISWGVLLGEAQAIKTIALNPWIMLPGLYVIIAVLAFNFVGDGLRDAADPYKE